MIIKSEVVVQDVRLIKINEAELLAELGGYLPKFRKRYAEIEALNRVFEPRFDKMCQRCAHQDIGINRYGREPADW